MIAVCEECHEADKPVIKCGIDKFKDHPGEKKEGVCEICGNLKTIHRCHRYGQYILTRA